MFSLVSKIVRRLTRLPFSVLALSAILAVLSIFPISQLRWDIQLQDTLSFYDQENSDYKKIENDFGGLGSLTVILRSSDSLQNYNSAKTLAERLQNDSLVHFVDFETDADFYTRNSLLYIDESDLDTIIDRVSTLKRTALARSNPFLVDLVEDSATTLPANAAQADLEKLQDKYFGLMATRFSNKEGTIRVVDIYPTNSHTDLKASRALLSATSEYLARIIDGKEIDVFYTGKVYDTIRQGNTMLPEAKLAGKLTALLILLLYIINFSPYSTRSRSRPSSTGASTCLLSCSRLYSRGRPARS